MNWKNFVCSVVCLAGMTCAEAVNYTPENVSASIALKVPGNDAKRYPLTLQQLDNSNFEYQWVAAVMQPEPFTTTPMMNAYRSCSLKPAAKE